MDHGVGSLAKVVSVCTLSVDESLNVENDEIAQYLRAPCLKTSDLSVSSNVHSLLQAPASERAGRELSFAQKLISSSGLSKQQAQRLE
jgi:hypothetical protein